MKSYRFNGSTDSLPTAHTMSISAHGATALYTPQSLSVSDGAHVGSGLAVPFSLDPYAGLATYDGKPIYTPQEAADNLNRAGVNFTFGNNGALDDGVLTFSFWQSRDQVENSYYLETDKDGYVLTSDAVYIDQGYFAPFTAEQQAMAIQNIGLWDDLIAVTFKQVADPNNADITFGFTKMSPASGAHTYFPQEEALNSTYGYVNAGKIAGDVWGNIAYQSDFSGANSLPGGYGWEAITHELGHSLGLSHTGDYNASDDNDGDGKPDPITYDNDAYYAQDSQQYSIMSYFDGSVTGQNAVDWDTGLYQYVQTPGVHDILAVQDVYGADYTTRSGDTVYGFNSTADRDIFDFTINDTPVLTIWDGGGKDTLDLSGFEANNIIDINEGAFSSAGHKISQDYLDYFASVGIDTQPELDAFYARNGLGPDGRPVDNISIAYGAKIENAVGGSGDDRLIGNALNNVLNGNGGNDTVSYETAKKGVTVNLASHTATGGGGHDTLLSIENAVGSSHNDSLVGDAGANTLDGAAGDDSLNGGAGNDTLIGGAGKDDLTGGSGNDIFVFQDTSMDKIRDFQTGHDKIDLSAFGIDSHSVKIAGSNLFADTDHNGSYDLHIVVQGDTVHMGDLLFA